MDIDEGKGVGLGSRLRGNDGWWGVVISYQLIVISYQLSIVSIGYL